MPPGATPRLDGLASSNALNVAHMEQDATSRVSSSARLAGRIASFCGSLYFVWFHLFWFAGWTAYNTVPWFASASPDPFPFNFLSLMVSLETVFLSAFILMSQGQEARLADRRSHLALQINILAEQESTKALHLLRRICEKLSINLDDDLTLEELEQATHHDTMVEIIERTIETPGGPQST